MFLLLPTAQADDVRKRAFVDWNYAVEVWSRLKTGAAFDLEYERVDPAYKTWKKQSSTGDLVSDVSALAQLEGKDADLARKGHDLHRVYLLWKDMYRLWFSGRGTMHPAEEWNQASNNSACSVIAMTNIFTGNCNDLPDWRTAEDVSRDDKVLADYLARESKRAAKSK